jgi:hypothetical protein
MTSLIRIVAQTEAIGLGTEDGLRAALASGELALLHCATCRPTSTA